MTNTNPRKSPAAGPMDRRPDCPDSDTLYLGAASRLPAERLAALLLHVANCERCARRMVIAKASYDEAVRAGTPPALVFAWIPEPEAIPAAAEDWIDRVLESLGAIDLEPAPVLAAAAKRGVSPAGPRVVVRGLGRNGRLRSTPLRHVVVISPRLDEEGGLTMTLRLDPSVSVEYSNAEALVVVRFRPPGTRKARLSRLLATVREGRLKIARQAATPALSGSIDLVQVVLRPLA